MKPYTAIGAAAALALALAQAAGAQETAMQSTTAGPPASASIPHPKAPLGRWITESGNLEVDVAPCNGPTASGGSRTGSTTLCGKVVRVLANRSMSAPGTDMAVADARPALGMTLLSALRDTGGGDYQGEIYNRENAKTYRATLTPAEPDQLLVRAYVGIPLFGKTQVWRRPAAEHGGAP